MDSNDKNFVERLYSVKKRFLSMYKKAHAGHIACSLSCAEILVFLRFFWMSERDNIILSKGHAAGALYSVLAEYGILSDKDIDTFYKDGTFLGAHPPANKIKGVPFATGSLGHGLSISAGMAFASRLKAENRLFFCVTSDGELDEGSVWEAALFISHNKLRDIIWLIDRNNIQGIGRTEDVMALEPLVPKLQSFGFFVAESDGHDFGSLSKAKEQCLNAGTAADLPKVIVCHTVKGHGVSYMENTVDWHYLPMNDEQYKKAMDELESQYRLAKSRS